MTVKVLFTQCNDTSEHIRPNMGFCKQQKDLMTSHFFSSSPVTSQNNETEKTQKSEHPIGLLEMLSVNFVNLNFTVLCALKVSSQLAAHWIQLCPLDLVDFAIICLFDQSNLVGAIGNELDVLVVGIAAFEVRRPHREITRTKTRGADSPHRGSAKWMPWASAVEVYCQGSVLKLPMAMVACRGQSMGIAPLYSSVGSCSITGQTDLIALGDLLARNAVVDCAILVVVDDPADLWREEHTLIELWFRNHIPGIWHLDTPDYRGSTPRKWGN